MSSKRLGVVGTAGGGAAFACPVGMEELAPWLVEAFVGVSAEIVPLGLQ